MPKATVDELRNYQAFDVSVSPSAHLRVI